MEVEEAGGDDDDVGSRVLDGDGAETTTTIFSARTSAEAPPGGGAAALREGVPTFRRLSQAMQPLLAGTGGVPSVRSSAIGMVSGSTTNSSGLARVSVRAGPPGTETTGALLLPPAPVPTHSWRRRSVESATTPPRGSGAGGGGASPRPLGSLANPALASTSTFLLTSSSALLRGGGGGGGRGAAAADGEPAALVSMFALAAPPSPAGGGLGGEEISIGSPQSQYQVLSTAVTMDPQSSALTTTGGTTDGGGGGGGGGLLSTSGSTALHLPRVESIIGRRRSSFLILDKLAAALGRAPSASLPHQSDSATTTAAAGGCGSRSRHPHPGQEGREEIKSANTSQRSDRSSSKSRLKESAGVSFMVRRLHGY